MLQIITPELIQKIQIGAEEMALSILQAVFHSVLINIKPYIPWLIIGSFLLLGFGVFQAHFGKTKLIGSIIYHIIFFTIFAIIVLIYGPKILLNNYFEAIVGIIYLISFRITGIVLDRINITNGIQQKS
jgi:hypothetical protein